MDRPKCSLTWDGYKKSICHGLTSLQQNGEFVDMTLAADGHLVKVHQVIIALASPYIKQLISVASCPHPVIFLNKISYETLCAILEYMYTGQVVIPIENLKEFAEAGKELHIHGLEHLDDLTTPPLELQNNTTERNGKSVQFQVEIDPSESNSIMSQEIKFVDMKKNPIKQLHSTFINQRDTSDVCMDMNSQYSDNDADDSNTAMSESTPIDEEDIKRYNTQLLYSLSNQGNLQVIMNRFIYNLRGTNSELGRRFWRCVEYPMTHCCATIATNNDRVVARKYKHNHAFHDTKIMHKKQADNIFFDINEVIKHEKCKSYKHKVLSSFRSNETSVDEGNTKILKTDD